MRATMSVPPPAPKPTIRRIGRSFGHSAEAGAAMAQAKPIAQAAATMTRFINPSPVSGHCWPALLSHRERGSGHGVNGAFSPAVTRGRE